ncbi:CpsD/CapB family tyrosine-protein kinase [Sinorhizobium terangae]|uniref:CpsD/CapB family tyrosine-protein kinase n=1 Tax=Sinorhizobium terangae TaxID=110322 RepID=UPI001294A277|nr:CpsD/CapB family tyrosine-protein kinase [Sinorhizobium terangae]
MESISTSLQGIAQVRAIDRASEQTIHACSRIESEVVWAGLPALRIDPAILAQNRVVTINRSTPARTPFDMMRTKILQTLRQNNWTSVAITSPAPSCGKTFLALNLAFSLADQKDCRTLLVDVDLRRPQIGERLGVTGSPPFESFLNGRSEISEVFLRHDSNLAVGVNGQPVPFSAETLQSPETTRVLRELRQRMSPDVILYDMSSMLSTDDVIAFLPNVDCVILVAAAERTTLSEVDSCEQYLSEKSNVLGVVLNDCRFHHGY